MLINEVSIALDPELHPSGTLLEVPTYVPGTNELLVLVNNAIAYVGVHYLEPDATHIQILFDASLDDILTAGLLSGYSYGPVGWLDKLVPIPTLKYAKSHSGSITLGLPVATTDARVTHLQIHRNRGGVLTLVDTVSYGTASYLVPDARIGDEYYLRTQGTNGLLGPASKLVRIRSLVSQSPKAA